jgi:single stranded DNA-binding protein
MPPRLNKVEFFGNIGAPPEYKNKEGEGSKCVFTFAVDRIGGGGETEKKKKPIWFRVTLWGAHADNAVRLGRKGMRVYVEGRFDVSDWEEPGTGTARYTLEIAGRDVQVLDSLEPEGAQGQAGAAEGPSTGAASKAPRRSGRDDEDLTKGY